MERDNKIQEKKQETSNKPQGVYACPECGSYLVRQGGCTVCSNPACIYEGCGF